MSNTFAGSASDKIELSNFDTSNVTDISQIFTGNVANQIYVKDQAMLDKLVNNDSVTSDRLQIKQP